MVMVECRQKEVTSRGGNLRGRGRRPDGRCDMSDSTPMVKCRECEVEKPSTPEYFYFVGGKRHGAVCKECRKAKQTEYRRSDPERIREQRKRYAERHPETVAAGKRRWYEASYQPCPLPKMDPEEVLRRRRARARGWRLANLERATATMRDWERKNSQHVAIKRRERYRHNPRIRVRHSIGAGMWRSIKDAKAGRSWESFVGYTLAELMAHLEALFLPGMTWENYGQWHIDHKRPVSSFSFVSPECPDFMDCWALDNLQPLWAADNIRKGARWDGA